MNTRIGLAALCFLLVGVPVTVRALDPTATAVVTNVDTAGATSYSFQVRYEDDGPINEDSIDGNDVRVTGPSGLDVAAAFVAEQQGSLGPTTVNATYSIVPPGGSWDSSDNGTYRVVMQPKQVFDTPGNAVRAGVIGTFNVSIQVGSAAPAQLLNISTRMRVQTGDKVMIGGFIITGNVAKKVIIRALGPTLAQFGIADVLADPVLELRASGGSLVKSNDNWKETQQAEIQSAGFAPQTELESALIATLNPGNYTAVVSGKNLGTGVGLVELYDMDEGADAKLANISTRGFVLTGTNVMIGGFILGKGTGAANLAIRGIGPSLTPFGIADALADPNLELRDSNGALMRSNDNWQDTQQTQIQTAGMAPGNAAESVIIATLPPGAYTAILTGKNNTTGVALVEVYTLP